MPHTREEVIERTIREFEQLNSLVSGLSDEDWERPLIRPESKDPWTVKDALAHITYWKADVARSARGQHLPPEERGMQLNDRNHLIYMRWRDRSPQEVLAWHQQFSFYRKGFSAALMFDDLGIEEIVEQEPNQVSCG